MDQPSGNSSASCRKPYSEMNKRYLQRLIRLDSEKHSIKQKRTKLNQEERINLDSDVYKHPEPGNSTDEFRCITQDTSSVFNNLGNQECHAPMLSNAECHDYSLKTDLADWAVSSHVSRNNIDKLLSILKRPYNMDEFKNLASDSRTLLKTNNTGKIEKISGGYYYHFGLVESVSYILNFQNIHVSNDNILSLHVNFDGLPLTKSSASQFWPILGCLNEVCPNSPFVVGIFHNNKKPQSPSEYLHTFIDEYESIAENGFIYKGRNIHIKLTGIICDAPAKSFILGVKGHNSYFGCTKCVTEGTFVNGRMSYRDTSATLRTDKDFRRKTDEDYHVQETPLLRISHLNIVDDVPLDSMHLVYLGVMKKLLNFWTKSNIAIRMNNHDLDIACAELQSFRNVIYYKDFSRLPRSLKDLDRWKATEFRQFLLYTGPLVLKDRLKSSQYTHFLCLHVSIRILSSSLLHLKYNNYAQQLLIYFVENFEKIYGLEYISHNVHNLIHLTKDVLRFGPLECFSAFRFENYLKDIKNVMKTSKKPLEQLINRVHEYRTYKKPQFDGETVCYTGVEYNEPVLDNHLVKMIKIIKHNKCYFGCDVKNNHAFLNGNIIQIDKIVQCCRSSKIYIIFKKYSKFLSYFDAPCESIILQCGEVRHLKETFDFLNLSNTTPLVKCFKYKNYVISYLN